VQVEIDRSLYLDEAQVLRSADFDAFRKLVDGVVATVVAGFRPTTALAAE
jgi:hypothetical protein